MIVSLTKLTSFLSLVGLSSATFEEVKQLTIDELGAERNSFVGRGSRRFAFMNGGNSKVDIYANTWSESEGTDYTRLSSIPFESAPKEAQLTGDHVSGDRLLAMDDHNVYVYKVDWTEWSQLSTFTQPEDYEGTDYNPGFLAIDRKTRGGQVAVGCNACDNTGAGAGEIHVHEATDKDRTAYELTQTLAFPWFAPSAVDFSYQLGSFVGLYDDVLVSNVLKKSGVSAVSAAAVFTKSNNGLWSSQQTLHVLDGVSNLAIHDDTIVLTNFDDNGAAYIFNSNGRQPPGPKSAPRQWSQVQTLTPPGDARSGGFGSDLSIDGNTLSIASQGNSTVHIFKRPDTHGKWSFQQSLVSELDFFSRNYLEGANLIAAGSGEAVTYSEDVDWKCLIVTLEDQFGDGWDTARLIVEGPNGVDNFAVVDPECDFTGSYQFRYCPNSLDESGLYKFSVPGGKDAKFNWEIQWSVLDEATGELHRGDHTSRMDFEFKKDQMGFSRRAIVHEKTYNATCTQCKPKPAAPKAKPHGRALTDPTPSPTLAQSEVDDWQYFNMGQSDAAWFHENYHGTSFYISDVDGKHLHSWGTSCDLENLEGLSCWQTLPDNNYVLRVTGALSPTAGTVSWDFCGRQGGANEVLLFNVKGDVCTPIAKYSLSYYCDSELVNVQTILYGEMVISGVGIDKTLSSDLAFTSVERDIVTKTLTNIIPNSVANDFTITNAYGNDGGAVVVQWSVVLNSNAQGISPYSYSEQLEMVESMEGLLSAASGSSKLYKTMLGYVADQHSSLFLSLDGVMVQNVEVGLTTMQIDESLSKTTPDTLDAKLNMDHGASSSTTASTSDSVTLFLSAGGVLVAILGVVAFAVVAFTRSGKPEHAPVASRDVEMNTSAPPTRKAVATNASLDRNMLEGLAKMVKDEDATLAKAMSAGHFN